MTINQINATVAEAIEELRMAQPGRGPADVRSNHRAKAAELLGSIARRDLVKVDDELANLLAIYA